MLRKTMLFCMLCLAAAAFSPAVSRAAMMEGTPNGFKYTAVTETEGGTQTISGELDNTNAQAYLYSWESQTGEFAYLENMTLQYWPMGRGAVVKFSQTLDDFVNQFMGYTQAVGYEAYSGLLVNDKNAHGNCYFAAFIPLDGSAGYEDGNGFSGTGNMLCIMGSATLNIDGYPSRMMVFSETAASLDPAVTVEPISTKPATVSARMMAAGAVILYIDGGYVDVFSAQRAAARTILEPMQLNAAFYN